MKKQTTLQDFKRVMKAAGIRVGINRYSDFIAAKLKTESGVTLNNTITTPALREKHGDKLGFISTYKANYEVFDGMTRVVF